MSTVEPGQKLSHYRLVEKIGEGGMGVVYRALDEHLERDVAIKVLPARTLADEATRTRFRKEALALSKLNHPNIATVFDFDTQDDIDFLAMEFVEGETLSRVLERGALDEDEFARLGIQLAEGLAAAHQRGIVHRDLKPANLRVTGDGRLKILDFGLVKLLRRDEPGGEAPTETLTHAAGVVGTPPYMAPEQMRDQAVDERTDVYSAGAVLYEMATGSRAHPETQSAELIEAVLTRAPRPPRKVNARVSPGAERVILMAIQKRPEDRYQSASDLLEDLRRLDAGLSIAAPRARARIVRWWILAAAGLASLLIALVALNVGGLRNRWFGAAGSAPIESVAVLPLENLSGDPEQEYFADGITEALITDLGQVRALRVIARPSVMRFKDSDTPLSEIARELRVEALVVGSVVLAGDRVRVTANLIDPATGRQIWANSYRREFTDILALQAEITQAIVREIRVTLTPQEHARFEGRPAFDAEAHRLYLQGRFFWSKTTQPALERSIDLFRQATEKDPTHGPAHADLVASYALLGQMAALPREEYLPAMQVAAARALEIDESSAEAHSAVGLVKLEEWDWEGAERELKRATELNPNYSLAYLWRSQVLNVLGRHEEALEQIRRAQDLDPVNPFVAANLLARYYYARRYDELLRESEKLIEMFPDVWLHHWLRGFAYSATGSFEEAISELQLAVEGSGGSLECLPALGYAYARSGRPAEAREILDRFEAESGQRHVPAFYRVMVYLGLGDDDQVFAWLERSFSEHDWRLPYWLSADPRFDPLRNEPRFEDLLRRSNVPG